MPLCRVTGSGWDGTLGNSPDDRTAEYLLPSESELHLVEINQCCAMQKNEGMKFLSMFSLQVRK